MNGYPDVVVVVPGIMGSTLLDRHGHEVWGLSAGALVRNLVTLARGIRALRLPEGVGDGHPDDGVTAGALMPDLHVVPGVWTISVGYAQLLSHLRTAHALVPFDPKQPNRPANLVPFAYDWRLSNRYNGRRLKSIVEPALERWRSQPGRAEAKLVFVCHSMGGLVARWYLDREGGAPLARSLITIGTPHRGAASAVDRLVNGVRHGLGPLALDLTGIARSLPSLHQLLPEYACIERDGQLSKIDPAGLPGLSTAMVADALVFHDQLDAANVAGQYPVYGLVGTQHPTDTTVRLTGQRAKLVRTINDRDEKGDSTVPRLSALPKGMLTANPAAAHYLADTHTALPGNHAVLNHLDGALTARQVEHLAPEVPIGVIVDEFVPAGEPVLVRAEVEDEKRLVFAQLTDIDTGQAFEPVRLYPQDRDTPGKLANTFDGVPPGAYQIMIGWDDPFQMKEPVTAATLVVDLAVLNEA